MRIGTVYARYTGQEVRSLEKVSGEDLADALYEVGWEYPASFEAEAGWEFLRYRENLSIHEDGGVWEEGAEMALFYLWDWPRPQGEDEAPFDTLLRYLEAR